MMATIDAITNLLFIETELKPVDLAFIFGSTWIKTMKPVSQLYKQGLFAKILISGGRLSLEESESEALKLMTKGVELGIPESVFLLEDMATNTKENLSYSLPLIEQKWGMQNINSILLVCKTFHARRALMTAKKIFPKNINYLFLPIVDERNIKKDNWWQSTIARQRVLEEIKRIGEYALKGDIEID